MQPPPKTFSELANKFIIENLLFIGYVCLVLFCSVLASMASPSKGKDNITNLQRVAYTLLGVILVSALLGIAWNYFTINSGVMAFLSAFAGIAAFKVSHWALDSLEKSETPIEFLGKIGKIIGKVGQIVTAIRKVVNDQEPPTDKPETP